MPAVERLFQFTRPITVLGGSDALILVAVSGLAMHQVARRFEPKTPAHMTALVILPPSVLTPLIYLTELSISISVVFALTLALYLLTLSLSVVIYRLSPWHPLASYPGPLGARVSKLWIMWKTRHGEQYRLIKEWHETFGDYVRVGPNEISIRNVAGVIPVLGATGLSRGPSWDGRNSAVLRHDDRSLIGLRVWKTHAERRKLWDKGFNSAALKDYEQIVIRRGKQLIEALDARRDRVNIATWLGYFTFDFMGDMAFGGGFELMRDGGDKEGVWTILKESQPVVHMQGHAPGLAALAHQFTSFDHKLLKMRHFASTWSRKRMTEGSFFPDLWHHLYEVDNTLSKHSMVRITGDAVLAIIAGSDTTSTVLSNACFFLCQNPEYIVRLQVEIEHAFPDFEEPFDALRLSQMPILSAVINESLRLQPPVPSGSQRASLAGSTGKTIGERYIPGGTQVFVHTYSLHRDARYFFPYPESFWPDRWLPETERHFPTDLFGPSPSPSNINASAVLDHTAFIPFSFGPANCVGKNLAILEMRMILSLLFQKFDMRFAKGYDRSSWLKEQRDWFVMEVGGLEVELTPRF